MAQIGDGTLDQMNFLARTQMQKYKGELNEAYLAAGDEPLKVSISFKVTPAAGGHKIECGIGFVTGKVKDSAVVFVDEAQQPMFPEKEAA